MKNATPWGLGFYFAAISLLAIGGADTIVPEMHRHMVLNQHWLRESDFVQMYAIARLAPGPNVMMVSLTGLRLCGWLGCLIVTLGICAPSGIFTHFLARHWHRFEGTHWHRVFSVGLLPVTLGLTAATAWVLVRASVDTAALGVVTAVGTLFAWRTKLSPLWLVLVAGILGALLKL